jgi:hypothetical protein
MSRRAAALSAVIAAGALVAVVPAGAGARAHAPAVHAAAACSVGTGEGYGYAYLTSLTVHDTTCSVGFSLVRHKGKVHGWKCVKKVLAQSPVQVEGRMTCTGGARKVVYGFTQNT